MHALHDWVRLIPVPRSSRYWKVCILISRISEHPQKICTPQKFPALRYHAVNLQESRMQAFMYAPQSNKCIASVFSQHQPVAYVIGVVYACDTNSGNTLYI